MITVWMLGAMLSLGCGGRRGDKAAASAAMEADVTETVEAPSESETPSTDAQPQAEPMNAATSADMYEQCRVRVEGRESAGECATDADCAAVGCSGEVCVSKTMAAGLATTCEVLPCFAVLDTCGCSAGVCSWALKDAPDPIGGPGRAALPPPR